MAWSVIWYCEMYHLKYQTHNKYSMTKWIAFCNSAMIAHGRALSLKWIWCTVFFSLIQNQENTQNYASIERLYTFAIFIIENQHITYVVFTHRDSSVMQQHFCHAKKYAANCNKKSGLFAGSCTLLAIATCSVGVNRQKIESCKLRFSMKYVLLLLQVFVYQKVIIEFTFWNLLSHQ